MFICTTFFMEQLKNLKSVLGSPINYLFNTRFLLVTQASSTFETTLFQLNNEILFRYIINYFVALQIVTITQTLFILYVSFRQIILLYKAVLCLSFCLSFFNLFRFSTAVLSFVFVFCRIIRIRYKQKFNKHTINYSFVLPGYMHIILILLIL